MTTTREDLIGCLVLHFKKQYATEKFLGKYRNASKNFLTIARELLLADELKRNIELAHQIIEQCHEKKYRIITILDLEYPSALLQLHEPPFVFFAKGNLNILRNSAKTVGVVGTRKPSLFSIHATKYLVNFLSQASVTIASGMAIGIDSVAHHSSLEHPNGSTIGVLAHGLDYVYPQSNFRMFQIANKEDGNLLLVSEYPPKVKPLRYHFPRRNRIIAALANSLFFIEGGVDSGAMITAKHSLELNKEIFAIDNEHMKNNGGGKKLLEDGATSIKSFFNFEILHDPTNKKILQPELFHFMGQNQWLSFRQNTRFQTSV